MAAVRFEPITPQSSSVKRTCARRFGRVRSSWLVNERSLPPRQETSANRKRSFNRPAGLADPQLHNSAWQCPPAFDPVIRRMLEYADAMPTLRRGLSWGVCLIALFAVGCAGNKTAPVTQPVAPSPAIVVASQDLTLKSDPVADVIALSDQHFESGRKELDAGHLETAKTEFNRSLEVLLEWPGGTRSEP